MTYELSQSVNGVELLGTFLLTSPLSACFSAT
jgi:hypothetical protein